MEHSTLKYFLLIGLLVSIPSFAGGVTCDANDNCTGTYDLGGSSTDSGLVSASQAQPTQTSGANRGMSADEYARMAVAKCAAVAQILDNAQANNKTCVNNANTWQTERQAYCAGLSSNTSTNTVGGNVKVVSGSSTNTTNSGLSPDVCTTQMNVTYGIKMTSCASDNTNTLKAAEIQKDAFCKK